MSVATFLSAAGDHVARAQKTADGWQVEKRLDGVSVTYLLNDPANADGVFAGTRDRGVMLSDDRGETWRSLGLEDQVIKSVAVSPADPNVIYAGAKPPMVFVSRDRGESWSELESFRKLRRWFWFTPAEPGDPYVMGLVVSPTDPNVVIAGVELGGVFRSDDGGVTWSTHAKGTTRDCHSLRFHHSDPNYVYQAGGGWPGAVSADGGVTWNQPKRGLGWSFYGMACAADPKNPNFWYLSAAPMAVFPQLHKMPRGHWDGNANAFIFRKTGDDKWKRLSGGLPEPLDHMAYALVTDPQTPGHLYAGLSNGDVWHSKDYGDSWLKLPFSLGAVWYSLVIL